MRFRVLCGLALSVVAGSGTLVVAADLPMRPRQAIPSRAVSPKRVSVVVDRLSLANGCPHDPGCIAPRVLPIIGNGDARERVYESIAIPVDPRFATQY